MVFCSTPWWTSSKANTNDGEDVDNLDFQRNGQQQQHQQLQNSPTNKSTSSSSSSSVLLLFPPRTPIDRKNHDEVNMNHQHHHHTPIIMFFDFLAGLQRHHHPDKCEGTVEQSTKATPETVTTTNETVSSPADTPTSSMIQRNVKNNHLTPVTTSISNTSIMSPTPFAKEQGKDLINNGDGDDEQDNWIALPPPEMKKTSRTLDFDAVVGNDNSSINRKEITVKPTTTQSSSSSSNNNSRFSIVKFLGLVILVAITVSSLTRNHHYHQVGKHTKADVDVSTNGIPFQFLLPAHTSSSKPTTINREVAPISKGSSKTTMVAPSPKPAAIVMTPTNAVSKVSLSVSTGKTLPPASSSVASVDVTTDAASTHSLDMSSLFFHWKKMHLSSTTSTTTPKEQFFPQIDRSVGWIKKHIHQVWFATDTSLHQLAHTLELLKNERTKQRLGYQHAVMNKEKRLEVSPSSHERRRGRGRPRHV